MLKYPEHDSSEESDDSNNSVTDADDEGHITQVQKFVEASKYHCVNENQKAMMTLMRNKFQ